ncbi:MAG: type IV toxin-antitoxin system AbiEi family antitoxin domain-containing protein [Elusimicrobiota bacterium]|nr:type IV toxin-antitoxin system AbiEi family antitoxin domain-containing protein [Elusimicrobiota bacterium]
MRQQRKRRTERLHTIASEQGGYFTAKQARAAGYEANAQAYHVHAGNWIREHRGIYRLKNYPPPERPELILWSLWSANRKGEPQGVYSHATALGIHDLSDLNPSKLHMTVPPGFRRSGAAPKALAVHKAPLHPVDTEVMHGYRVTKPLKTIGDLIAAGDVAEEHLRKAVKEAVQRGLLTLSQVDSAARLPREVRARIKVLAR